MKDFSPHLQPIMDILKWWNAYKDISGLTTHFVKVRLIELTDVDSMGVLAF